MSDNTFYHHLSIDSQGTAGVKFVNQFPVTLTQEKNSDLINLVRPYFRKYSTSELLNEIFAYERKYGLKSSKVYWMYQNNHLNRESKDFLNWAILYKKFFVK